MKIRSQKVSVSKLEVANFNSKWPCSELRTTRTYWFEFASNGDLIDTDCSYGDDGSAALAMSDDCKAWLFDNVKPEWAE